MREKESERIDEQFRRTLAGKADELFAEAEPFFAAQVWPPEDDLVEEGEAPQPKRRASGKG